MGIPIPGAYASPRISNGVLCWYAGDTFSVVIQADLVDQDGAAVEVRRARVPGPVLEGDELPEPAVLPDEEVGGDEAGRVF